MPKHATLHYRCAIPQAPIRLQGSSAVAAAGALGDWTLEGAPDLIEAMNVSRQIFRMSTHWLLESQTMTWTWIIYIYIYSMYMYVPEMSRTYISVHQRCNMTNPRSYDYLQKRNKLYTNSILNVWLCLLQFNNGANGWPMANTFSTKHGFRARCHQPDQMRSASLPRVVCSLFQCKNGSFGWYFFGKGSKFSKVVEKLPIMDV